MVDLDSRLREGRRPEPDGELDEIQIEKKPGQTTNINKALPTYMKEDLITVLKSNADLFAWTVVDKPKIDLEFMSHQLSVFLRA